MSETNDTQVGSALRWIVNILEERSLPFLVVGGLAARAYGATRPVADIDLYVPSEGLASVFEAVRPNVKRALARHVDAHWDLEFMQLEYGGEVIELGVADGAKYWDSRAGRWRDAAVDFKAAEIHELYGISVPVMPRKELLTYKERLGREVDRADVEAILTGSTEPGNGA
jgi:hypothetical protein